MKRQECIDKITVAAGRFVEEVKGFNTNGLYNINVHAENFLIPVFNSVFQLQLENLNHTEKKNFPAIDLLDKKNRAAFQITSTSDFSKIKTTLETFAEHRLQDKIDTLYIYILTGKQSKYSDEKLKDLIPDGFVFNTQKHVLDKDNLLERINAISSTPVIEQLAKIFQQEFSDIKIEQRGEKFKNGYLNPQPEELYPNLLEIGIPQTFYRAELNIDEEKVGQEINDYQKQKGWASIKKFKPRTLVKNALRQNEVFSSDWILHENALYTFHDLHQLNEPLRKIIDIGTITPLASNEYHEQNEDTSRVFKHLLRNTFMEFCKTKDIEWFGEDELFRFANNRVMPNKKKVRWKAKNESSKTVIFEMMNKEKTHIVCFRSLAFRAEFDFFSDQWYLVLNPTWSFTNPFGYKKSRFEAGYLSGIKAMENNSAVCNYFRFFAHYFQPDKTDLFHVANPYPYFEVKHTKTVSFTPRLDDNKWKPVKKGPEMPELEFDKELENTFEQ